MKATLQTLLWAVGLAMWFVYWSPLIFGFALQQLIGMFPIIVCYSLLPESQFKPLVYYFLALAYVCFSPFWFALVELFARWGASLAPTSNDAHSQSVQLGAGACLWGGGHGDWPVPRVCHWGRHPLCLRARHDSWRFGIRRMRWER